MALNDVYQLTAIQLIGGKECANTFYFQETVGQGSPTSIVATDLSLEFWSAIWRPSWRTLVAKAVQLTSIFAYRIWPTVDPGGFQAFTLENGLRGLDAVPNGSAVLISARDVTNSPNFRRRFYFSGLPEIDSAQTAIIPSARLGWDNFATILRTITLIPPSLFPGEYTPIPFSKSLAALGPPTIPYALFSSGNATYPLRSQRGRNPRFTIT